MEITSFQDTAIRSSQLEEYDEKELTTSQYADNVADSIANCFIKVLDDRIDYRGRAIRHGSFTRQTNLAKPGISDVDVLCFIGEGYGYDIHTLSDFEQVREDALVDIKNHLLQNLDSHFYEVNLHQFWPRLCVSFLVKTGYRARTPWKVDVIIAFEGVNHNGILREMRSLSRTEANHNANALSIQRNDLISRYLDDCPRLRKLIRLVKHFNTEISMSRINCRKEIAGFVFEVMIVILYANGDIPENFAMNRALCTCLETIAFCENDIYLQSDVAKVHPEYPCGDDLDRLEQNCEPSNGLVVLDPVAPSLNIARNKKTGKAWAILRQDAESVYYHLKRNGVAPYRN